MAPPAARSPKAQNDKNSARSSADIAEKHAYRYIDTNHMHSTHALTSARGGVDAAPSTVKLLHAYEQMSLGNRLSSVKSRLDTRLEPQVAAFRKRRMKPSRATRLAKRKFLQIITFVSCLRFSDACLAVCLSENGGLNILLLY
jgi:hypothetical protein